MCSNFIWFFELKMCILNLRKIELGLKTILLLDPMPSRSKTHGEGTSKLANSIVLVTIYSLILGFVAVAGTK